jgi:type II secretory pathway pseudopilin PulG
MKLTNTRNVNRKSGMTLLELTVVILVLLSLISILFIGARAWKKGSDRSASILTIRNVQQAVRSFANMNGKKEAVAGEIATTDLFGAGKFMQNDPTAATTIHPGGGTLKYEALAPTVIPPVGTLYLTVSGAATDTTPASYFMPEGYGTPQTTVGDW